MVGDVERDKLRLLGDASVARCAIELVHQRARRDLPRQRVFAPAGAEDEDVHAGMPDERSGAAGGLTRARLAATAMPRTGEAPAPSPVPRLDHRRPRPPCRVATLRWWK